VAAGGDERLLGTALRGPDRHAGEVDAVQDVGVDELGRQVERQDVERPGRPVRVDREERDPVPSHEGLEVDPRGIGALGQGVGSFVEDLVEDLQALVRKADLVGVGVGQQPRDPPGVVRGTDGAVLEADVAGRLLDLRQQRFEAGPEVVHDPPMLPPHRRADRYRNRRMWTFSTRPMQANVATVLEPP
jgi:hypothetical protein